MLLKKIVLKNFRQFYGEQTLDFSTDKYSNVTLIHAENGVGKTTLLNALLWCFYQDFTQRFEGEDKILSFQAAEEGALEASVEVIFLHDDQEYSVKRKINQTTGQLSFEAYLIRKGNYEALSNPSAFVDTVIPREMSKYFFFDGEYAESFSGKRNKKEVRFAVENMLGCNIAVQTKADLNKIRRELDKEIGALTKNNQSEMWQKQIEIYENDNIKKLEQLKNIKESIEIKENRQLKIQEDLKKTKGAKETQEKRDLLNQQKTSLESDLRELEIKKTQWIEEYSIGLLSSKVSVALEDCIKEAGLKGQIPSNYAEDFVRDILESKMCVCSRPFEAGSSEEKAISSLMASAGTVKMQDRLLAVKSLVGGLTKQKEMAVTEFKSISKELDKTKKKIAGIETEIAECGTLLKDSNVKEIVEKEQKYEQLKEELTELVIDKTNFERDVADNNSELSNAKAKRDKLLAGDERARDLQFKVQVIDQTIKLLDDELNSYREESRSQIIKKVNSILSETARRNYRAEIDEEFNLEMYHGDGDDPVAKSGGENQLLSLSFIASLVDFASERINQDHYLLKPGTTAPLMLDSPFGQLDPTYRKSTAEFLPKLSDQVLLLVSKTQGDDDVITALGDRIGAEYVLISENKDEQGNKPSDIISIKGKSIQCSIYGADKNRTIIEKV